MGAITAVSRFPQPSADLMESGHHQGFIDLQPEDDDGPASGASSFIQHSEPEFLQVISNSTGHVTMEPVIYAQTLFTDAVEPDNPATVQFRPPYPSHHYGNFPLYSEHCSYEC